MPPTQEHTTRQADGAPDVGAPLLTGDLGAIVVRGLLENGVGYIVSSWRDRPTPIDAAIDDARRALFERRGVVLRRLQTLSALEPLVTAPAGGLAGETPRGAVVFAGRRGMRPALESFVRLRAAGAVIGFTFDEEVLHIEDAVVVDPEPTAIGLMRAIDAAFEASARSGHPAVILVRDRLLGMRGTVRCREERQALTTAVADAAAEQMLVEDAAAAAGLVDAQRGIGGSSAQPVVVVCGPLAGAARRALSLLAADLSAVGAEELVDDIAVVMLSAPTILPSRGAAAAVLRAAPRALVLGARANRVAERCAAVARETVIDAVPIDVASARGEMVCAAIATWLRSTVADDAVDVRAVLDRHAAGDGAATNRRTATRVPRRGEQLHRSIEPAVAAGLELAQGVIGVPGRIDAAFPTYATDTGVPLTVVPTEIFAAHAAASAAPGSAPGVFLVTGSGAGGAEAAAAMGATIEYVDGNSPRALGRAIGMACRSPRIVPHVLLVTRATRVAAPRAATLGIDPELLATERLATAAVPTASKVLADMGQPAFAGPVELLLDRPETVAAIDVVRELSPATWDLTSRGHARGKAAAVAWQVRRRLVRAAGGVDL